MSYRKRPPTKSHQRNSLSRRVPTYMGNELDQSNDKKRDKFSHILAPSV